MPAQVDPTRPSAPEALSPRRQTMVLAVLVLPVLLISVDNTVLGFAIPEISADLRPSSGQLLWIADSYAFMLAGLLITMGHLGDRIGRRRLLLIGAAAFGAASVFGALATSANHLIAARTLLGICGATLMPSTLSILRNVFVDPQRRRTAIGVWASAFAIGGAVGPLAGGWLLEHFWWGSVFLLNLPAMVVLLIAAPLLIPESRNPSPGRFDLISSPLSLFGIVPLVYSLKHLAEHGFDLTVVAAAAVGVAFVVAFIRRQRRIEDPMVDLSLFASRTFSLAVMVNLVCNMAMVGGIYFLAQHLQAVSGLSPLSAGVHLIPAMVAAGAMSVLIVPLSNRGPGLGTWLAMAVCTAAVGYLSMQLLSADSSPWAVAGTLALVGIGVGSGSTLGANLVMSAVPAERAGSASAVSETAFELGAAIGIALLGASLTAVYRRSIELPAGLPAEAVRTATDSIGGALATAGDLDAGAAAVVVDAARSAYTSGLHVAAGVAAAVLALAGAVMIRQRRRIEFATDATHDH